MFTINLLLLVNDIKSRCLISNLCVIFLVVFTYANLSYASFENSQNQSGSVYHVHPKNSEVKGDNILLGLSNWPVIPQPGDVLYLYDSNGPFTENMTIPKEISDTSDKPITVKAAPDNFPLIEGVYSFFRGISYYY